MNRFVSTLDFFGTLLMSYNDLRDKTVQARVVDLVCQFQNSLSDFIDGLFCRSLLPLIIFGVKERVASHRFGPGKMQKVVSLLSKKLGLC